MFIKLCVLVVVLGSSGVGVLSARQARLVAAHEATEARLRTRSLERGTRELRIEIIRRVTPDALRERIDTHAALVPSTDNATTLAPLEPGAPDVDGVVWIRDPGAPEPGRDPVRDPGQEPGTRGGPR